MFPDSFLDQIRAALPVLEVVSRRYTMRKAGSAEYKAAEDESLTVNSVKNLWHDFGKGQKGGDIFDFERFVTGCTFQEAVERLAQMAGLPLPRIGRGNVRARPAASRPQGDMGPEPPPPEPSDYGAEAPQAQKAARVTDKKIVKTYDYVDPDGTLLYQVCREEWIGNDGRTKKNFFQRRPYGAVLGDDDKQPWIWGLSAGVYIHGKKDWYSVNKERLQKYPNGERVEIEAVSHILFHWPQLREEMAQAEGDRRTIFVVEGEKDCETLEAWGCVATTNSGGAGNWRPEHAEELRGADVVVIQDNDQAGVQRGHAIALSLRYVAASVRCLSWPQFWRECPSGGDVTDWRDKGGGTADKLFEIVDQLRDWSPEMPKSEFGAVRFADIDKMTAPLVWTVKGILQKSSISMWYGATQSGKSFLVTDMGMAVARGVYWMGHKTKAGLVIYQTGEGGAGFRQRVKAYRDHFKVDPNDDVPFVYLPARINLFEDDADVDKLIAEIKAWTDYYDHTLELVVVDTFNAASGGANENTNQDVGRVLERCRKIVEATGAHVAIVHHTPASGDRPRGHSSLTADIETTIAIAQSPDQIDREEQADGHVIERSVRTWSVTKQKDGPAGETKSFILRSVVVGKDEDNEDVTSCVIHSLQTVAQAANATRTVPPGWLTLNPSNEDIFRALVRAIQKNGRAPAAGIAAPKHELCVTIADWQNELLENVIGHEEITTTVRNRIKQRVMRAQKNWLPDKVNLIVKDKEWVWRSSRKVFGIDKMPPAAARPEPEPILAPGEDMNGPEIPF